MSIYQQMHDEPTQEDTFAPICWAAKEGKEPPKRKFIVQDWLPIGVATSLYAPGGTGKTMLAQLLASCIVTGRPFLGLATK